MWKSEKRIVYASFLATSDYFSTCHLGSESVLLVRSTFREGRDGKQIRYETGRRSRSINEVNFSGGNSLKVKVTSTTLFQNRNRVESLGMVSIIKFLCKLVR
jgi:hypothetical protein